MKLTTFILLSGLMLGFGPAQAQINDDCLSDTVVKSEPSPQPDPPSVETKDDYSVPEPAQMRAADTCATPRDGLESKDEGDRVMCDVNPTAK